MGLHESSVNFHNLIKDLAEMYPFEVDKVVVVELVANALDAKANKVSVEYNTEKKVLIVSDNGEGMTASQFDEYHDFAAGLKTRGTGIGFAGVGAKISFNVADRVISETRSKNFRGGSDWYLHSKKKLLWNDTSPSHLRNNGTRVEVHFKSGFTPSYATTDDLIQLLKRHYLPLFEQKFLALYQSFSFYSKNLRFEVNGRNIEPVNVIADLSLEKTNDFFPTKAGKKIEYGLFGLSASEYPFGSDACGVLLCTHGKVVKGDLFNQFPGVFGPRVFGLVEVPGFINFLTTAKTDFIRARGKYREFESLYDPIRKEFKAWLEKSIGIQSLESITDADEARKLEREIKKIVEDIPELEEFFGFRAKKTVLQPSASGPLNADVHEGAEGTFSSGDGVKSSKPGKAPLDEGEGAGQALVENQTSGEKKASPISRTARRGPMIGFSSAPEKPELSWVEGNKVVINSGHPSYAKIKSNAQARKVHSFFAIGVAVQRVMSTAASAPDLMFVDRLMTALGKK